MSASFSFHTVAERFTLCLFTPSWITETLSAVLYVTYKQVQSRKAAVASIGYNQLCGKAIKAWGILLKVAMESSQHTDFSHDS